MVVWYQLVQLGTIQRRQDVGGSIIVASGSINVYILTVGSNDHCVARDGDVYSKVVFARCTVLWYQLVKLGTI